jgi:hypothetical protein
MNRQGDAFKSPRPIQVLLRRRGRSALPFLVGAALVLAAVSAGGQGRDGPSRAGQGHDASNAPSQKGSDGPDLATSLEFSALTLDVNPDLQLVFPSGTVTQRSQASFNRLAVRFQLAYSAVSNDSSGSLEFSLPFKRLVPRLNFQYSLGFENTFAPHLQDGTLLLLPSDRYISRARSAGLGVAFPLSAAARLSTDLVLSDLFRGDLAEESVIEEGTDLSASLSFEYDTLQAQQPAEALLFRGTLFRSTLDLPVRTDLRSPLYLYSETLLKVILPEDPGWELDAQLQVGTPVYIWELGLTRFETLGGIDSVPGYAAGSIPAYWYVLSGLEVRKELFTSGASGHGGFTVKLGKLRTTVQQFTLSVLFDLALAQEALRSDVPLRVYPDVGLAFSVVITAPGFGHLSLRATLAEAIEPAATPIFYLTTSLFSFKTRVGS